MARKAGAIDAVVAVMRAHVGKAGVVVEACLVLGSLCGNTGTLARLPSHWQSFMLLMLMDVDSVHSGLG